MKLMIVFISISLLFSDGVSANGTKTLEQTLVDDKIYGSFRLIYLHLSYISHYMSKRSSAMMREQIGYLKHSQKIVGISEKICDLLGLKTERDLPYRTTMFDLKPDTLPTELEPYKDLVKVETVVKEALEDLVQIFQVWKEHFDYGMLTFDNESNREKNTNVYRLLYNDFLFIFFDVTKAIFDAYDIKYNKVKPQEVYAKEIYVNGLKSFVIKEIFVGLPGKPGIVQLAMRANEANTDLIKRMLTDITTQLTDCPPQIETLVKLFDHYKTAFQSI